MISDLLDKASRSIAYFVCDSFTSCGAGGEDMMLCQANGLPSRSRGEVGEMDIAFQMQLLKAFETLDTDKDGLITARQMYQIVENMRAYELVSDEEADEMIRVGDLDDQEGRVNYTAFLNAVYTDKKKGTEKLDSRLSMRARRVSPATR